MFNQEMQKFDINPSLSTGIKFNTKRFVLLCLIVLFFFSMLFMSFIGSFFDFKESKNVEIKSGQSLKTIALNLEEAGVVNSSSLLSSLVILIGGESHIVSGVYNFEKKEGAYFVAKRIVEGKTNIRSIKITFPEGFSSAQMAKKLEETFPSFSRDSFLSLTKEKEGYLFPDTYFFLPYVTAEDVIKKLEGTFWKKVEEKFGLHPNEERTKDIIILASIIEEEVQSLEDKKIVADLFLRRMKIGMPLQADSTLAYVTGRDSLSLTVDDLKSKSPYNSYTNKGLPPTPISNPGLESIEAVLNPTPNKYLYFLTDKEGKVYYAKTFDEHKQNKAKYLN